MLRASFTFLGSGPVTNTGRNPVMLLSMPTVIGLSKYSDLMKAAKWEISGPIGSPISAGFQFLHSPPETSKSPCNASSSSTGWDRPEFSGGFDGFEANSAPPRDPRASPPSARLVVVLLLRIIWGLSSKTNLSPGGPSAPNA